MTTRHAHRGQLAVAAVLALTAALVAGCGSSNSKNSTPTAAALVGTARCADFNKLALDLQITTVQNLWNEAHPLGPSLVVDTPQREQIVSNVQNACNNGPTAKLGQLDAITGPAPEVLQTDDEPPSDSASDSAPDTTSSENAPGASNTWVVESKASNGATWTASLEIGSLLSGSAIASAANTTILAACSVDSQTDAVIPFTVTTTSTTSGGFSATAASEFSFTNASFSAAAVGSGSGEELDATADYSDGSQCSDMTAHGADSHIGGSPTLAPGAISELHGFLILKNWASPAQPNGDPGFVPNVWVRVPGYGVYTDVQWLNESLTGPGVIDLRDTSPPAVAGDNGKLVESFWYFPVDGTSKADCKNVPPPLSGSDLAASCAKQSR